MIFSSLSVKKKERTYICRWCTRNKKRLKKEQEG